jgi:hypothetical protein
MKKELSTINELVAGGGEKGTIEVKKKSKIGLTKGQKLSLKEELFCQYYTRSKNLFGNGIRAYNLAYDKRLDEHSKEKPVVGKNADGTIKYGRSDYEKMQTLCSTEASRHLLKPMVNSRVQFLLNQYLTEEAVDAELAKVVMQDEELPAKVSAIREFNAVRGRIISKSDHTVKMVGVVKHFYDEVDKLEKEKYGKSQKN